MSAGLDFGRAICSDEGAAERREWLASNGLGGFASGTLGGVLTRSYHGLLVAALAPPLGRTLLGSRVDETVRIGGREFGLFANRWSDGTLEPRGDRLMERFRLEDGLPVWTFALGGALVEKRIWMEAGANLTYVRYRAARALEPLAFEVKALVNYRDFHGNTHAGEWRMQVEPLPDGVRVIAFAGAVPFEVRCERGSVAPAHEWYRNYELARERERGLDDLDDNLHVATFGFELAENESVTLSFRADETPLVDKAVATDAAASIAIAGSALSASIASTAGPTRDVTAGDAALDRARSRAAGVQRSWQLAQPKRTESPAWLEQLVLAADQFVVRRAEPAGSTLIAGYHWFGDWGRDTMIALPGLTLTTGRSDIAREILRTFAQLVDGGMLPNTLPAAGESPQYNTVDAALWFVEAVRLYVAATDDGALLADLYPVLRGIVRAYAAGTRFGIREDPADGLIAAGEPGVQLTWMDAKVGEHVITPRIGKPVEIAALWLNAQATLRAFAERLGAADDAASFAAGLERTRAGFARFWNAQRGFLYDVLDGPDGAEALLRPNQLFALSLPECALSEERQRAVVVVCARELLTTFGLRSLAPGEPGYCGSYAGDIAQRDGAYHQGTVWGWLIGPFALAHARAFAKPEVAAGFVAALGRQFDGYGIGTLPEIADGDAPHAPRGCIAQAWTVAEVLRAWTALAPHA